LLELGCNEAPRRKQMGYSKEHNKFSFSIKPAVVLAKAELIPET